MNNWLRWLFFAGPVRLLVLLVLGLNVRHHEDCRKRDRRSSSPITIRISIH
jgi:hypothetical protein